MGCSNNIDIQYPRSLVSCALQSPSDYSSQMQGSLGAKRSYWHTVIMSSGWARSGASLASVDHTETNVVPTTERIVEECPK